MEQITENEQQLKIQIKEQEDIINKQYLLNNKFEIKLEETINNEDITKLHENIKILTKQVNLYKYVNETLNKFLIEQMENNDLIKYQLESSNIIAEEFIHNIQPSNKNEIKQITNNDFIKKELNI